MTKYISQSFRDELLTRVDVVSVVDSVVPLKKSGANYIACCPFHEEKTPSFTVSQSKQFYHCFGCGVHGNAIGFLMEYEGLSYTEAIEDLAARVGLTVAYEGGRAQSNKDFNIFYDLLSEVAKFYRKKLRNSQQAVDYLKNRGLSGEITKQFGIGYSPQGWNTLATEFPDKIKCLLDIGLLIKKDNGKCYDRFRDRIMFPIRNRNGKIIAFGGRVLDDSLPKYLNSPESVIFHKSKALYGLYEARQANRKLSKLIVVEGYMDVVGLAQHDINFSVATLGTATTSEHLQCLFHSADEVIFCFDGDRAGKQAAWRALQNLLPVLRSDWQAKFLFLPSGEDPDSLIRAEGKEFFIKQLSKTIPLSEFFCNQLEINENLEHLDGRMHFINTSIPYINSVKSTFMRDLLITALSERIKLPLQQTYKYINNSRSKLNKEIKYKTSEKLPFTIRMAITLLLQHPHLINNTHVKYDISSLNQPGSKVLSRLINLLRNNHNLSAGIIVEHWRGLPEEELLLKLAVSNLPIPEHGILDEFCGVMKKLRNQYIQQLIDCLIDKANNGKLNNEEKHKLQILLAEKAGIN